jgi:hypothetical protein
MSTHVRHFGNTRAKDGTGLVTVVCNRCAEVRAAEATPGRPSLLDVNGECASHALSLDGRPHENLGSVNGRPSAPARRSSPP